MPIKTSVSIQNIPIKTIMSTFQECSKFWGRNMDTSFQQFSGISYRTYQHIRWKDFRLLTSQLRVSTSLFLLFISLFFVYKEKKMLENKRLCCAVVKTFHFPINVRCCCCCSLLLYIYVIMELCLLIRLNGFLSQNQKCNKNSSSKDVSLRYVGWLREIAAEFQRVAVHFSLLRSW